MSENELSKSMIVIIYPLDYSLLKEYIVGLYYLYRDIEFHYAQTKSIKQFTFFEIMELLEHDSIYRFNVDFDKRFPKFKHKNPLVKTSMVLSILKRLAICVKVNKKEYAFRMKLLLNLLTHVAYLMDLEFSGKLNPEFASYRFDITKVNDRCELFKTFNDGYPTKETLKKLYEYYYKNRSKNF